MVLLVLVIGGVAVFCFVKGYIAIGVVCLAGFSKQIGWAALIATSIYLFVHGHWVVAILPLLLMAWNLIGLRLTYRKKIINDLLNSAGDDIQ